MLTRTMARRRSFLAACCLLCAMLGLWNPAHAQVSELTWLLTTPVGNLPEARWYPGLGNPYDEVNDRLILFGGAGYAGTLGDLWVLVNASGTSGAPFWQQLTPAGPGAAPRSLHSAVYDPTSNRLIVHGGCGGACGPYFADTWVLTHANGLGGTPEWIQLPDGPRVRNGHTAAYDPGNNRMIVFGGGMTTVGSDGNDVAILINANGIGTPQWLELNPTGTLPPPIGAPATAVYDSGSNRLMLIGGRTGSSATYNDVWVLTHANGLGGTPEWSQLSPAGVLPSPRGGHILGYDPQTNRAILFGGGDAPLSTSYNDTWVLTNANGLGGTPEWQSITPTGGLPATRYGGIGAYAARMNRLIVTHGLDLSGGLLDDVWVLTSANGVVNTPPTIAVNDITLEGNTLGGRILAFGDIGSASDVEDANGPAVTCAPAEESLLSLGATSVSCTATDSGTLTASDSGTITVVDTIPPTITCPDNITGTVSQAIALGTPSVSDIVDGNPMITNNAPAIFPAGTTNVIWQATDSSGNVATCTQKVSLTYVFLGFYRPVDNPDVINVAKAGQAIPFKWSLKDANGNYVSDLATVTIYGYATLSSCAGTTDAIEEYVATGATSLRYDAAANQFVFTSQTNKLWVGSCKMFTLVLSDGTKHQAKFNFTR
jgi:hypothetical protein